MMQHLIAHSSVWCPCDVLTSVKLQVVRKDGLFILLRAHTPESGILIHSQKQEDITAKWLAEKLYDKSLIVQCNSYIDLSCPLLLFANTWAKLYSSVWLGGSFSVKNSM